MPASIVPRRTGKCWRGWVHVERSLPRTAEASGFHRSVEPDRRPAPEMTHESGSAASQAGPRLQRVRVW